jgi:hypothetical protein
MHMDAPKALAAIDAIRTALDGYTAGWANKVARDEINRHVAILRSAAPMHSAEKISSLLSWMEILFSARKHEKYRRGGTSGESMVRSFAIGDLNVITDQIRASSAPNLN